jgi:hypothetical protein
MSIEQNYDKTALLALPAIQKGSAPEKGLLSWSRPYLIGEVRKQGVDVVTTRSVAALDAENGIAKRVVRPEYTADGDVTIHELGVTALESFGVLRTIVKPVDVDRFVTGLNPYEFRTYARNKNKTAADFLRPAGLYDRQFTLIDPTQPLGEQLDTLPDTIDTLVAKPNVGRLSDGVKVGDRAAIAEHLAAQQDPFIVEEKMSFAPAMPGIKAIDESEQARLDEANRLGVNKELRLYYFGQDTWDSVMRVANPGETDFQNDNWLYIDQDSIPNEVFLRAAKVIEKIREKFSYDEVHICLDFVYVSTESQPEPHWEVMEMNVAEPQLIQEKENIEIGRRQHTKLATQIARIAVS